MMSCWNWILIEPKWNLKEVEHISEIGKIIY